MASIPKPFSRPSIDLSYHGKEWQMVTWEDVEVGDLIDGHGGLVAKEYTDPAAKTYRFEFVSGDVRYFYAFESVRAFTKKK